MLGFSKKAGLPLPVKPHGLWASSRVWDLPHGYFPGKAAWNTIGSPLWKSNWDPFMFLKVKLNSSQAASLLRENREKAKVKRCEDYFTWRYLKALCMDVIFNFKWNFNLGQGWWNNEATTYLYGSWDFFWEWIASEKWQIFYRLL